MREVATVSLMAIDAVIIAVLYALVARDDIRRDATATDEMWNRSIGEYRDRAAAAAIRRAVEEDLRCGGRIRIPIPAPAENKEPDRARVTPCAPDRDSERSRLGIGPLAALRINNRPGE